MSLSPDDDFNAAEFALGTLDAGERATIAARRLREPELDEAIVAWERRLAPLVESIPPLNPPRDFFADIEARIHGARSDAQSAVVIDLTRRVRRWRLNAIAGARDRDRTARIDARRDASRICRGPAEERGRARLCRHRQSRYARSHRASRRRAAAGRQSLRIMDHQ
jgi:hypothetical protein